MSPHERRGDWRNRGRFRSLNTALSIAAVLLWTVMLALALVVAIEIAIAFARLEL